MDLTGTWRAKAADEGLRRQWAGADLDDGDWAELTVPGHWASRPELGAGDGPVWYRRRFDTPAVPADEPDGSAGTRWWLRLDGIFDQGDVWLDGAYLGDTEGYFVRHDFEVTAALAARREHALAVEVTSTPPSDPDAKTTVTGLFGPPAAWGDWNPGGLWAPVRLERSGPVRIAALTVRCTEATAERAALEVRATLDSDSARTVVVATEVGAIDHRATHPLAAGPNEVAWTVVVDRPRLWWPRALGEAMLEQVRVAVETVGGASVGRTSSGSGACSDVRVLRTGLRRVTTTDWITTVNGERLFLKGTSQGPHRRALGEASPEELRADVAAVADAGLDLLRLRGHVSRPEVYDAADEAGLLVWQDLPLHGRYGRAVRHRAVAAAAAMASALGHHPCIALWCAHDDPDASSRHRGGARPRAARRRPLGTGDRLDRRVARALRRADPTRTVVAHAGTWPHLGELTGSAPAPGIGWEWGELDALAAWLRRWPRLAVFASAFGAASVPDTDDFCRPANWPEPGWPPGLGTDRLVHYVPPADHADFESWKQATQRYQCELVRRYVEELRRRKYRPAGGFTHAEFADACPGISRAVLDHRRRPKPALATLAAACRPVIVVADAMPARVAPGRRLRLDVHVVSDRRTPLESARVRAALEWPGGRRRWEWEGDVDADACVRVGRVDAVVPDAVGPARLDLVLDHRTERVENRYETLIAPRH